MTYVDYVVKQINKYSVCEPIYTATLAQKVAGEYDLPKNKAIAATSVAIMRIMDSNQIPLLRKYRKGIYYLTEESWLGELDIDKTRLFRDLYLNKYGGYETGYRLLYKLGLTTQLPAEELYAINGVKGRRFLKEYGVYIIKPRTRVTDKNKKIL